MKTLTVVLAVAALIVGLLGARLWYRSSKVVPIETLAQLYSGSEADSLRAVGGLFDAGIKAARLNKWAAIWTGISVAFGGAASVTGAFSN